MKSAPKGRNVAGVIPLTGWNNSFDLPWPDYLQPLREGFLAIERSVYECAYAGCDSIWVVCGDDVAPIVIFGIILSIITDVFVVVTSTWLVKVKDPIPRLMRFYSVLNYFYLIFVALGNITGATKIFHV